MVEGSARLARWGAANTGLAVATRSNISSAIFIGLSFLWSGAGAELYARESAAGPRAM
jgi:hypothetical protein